MLLLLPYPLLPLSGRHLATDVPLVQLSCDLPLPCVGDIWGFCDLAFLWHCPCSQLSSYPWFPPFLLLSYKSGCSLSASVAVSSPVSIPTWLFLGLCPQLSSLLKGLLGSLATIDTDITSFLLNP